MSLDVLKRIIKLTLLVLALSLQANDDINGVWCTDSSNPAVGVFEQPGAGDRGGFLTRSTTVCAEYKVMASDPSGEGGVGRYITWQTRDPKQAPKVKLHPNWGAYQDGFASVGLFSYMKDFDGVYIIETTDLIDHKRSGYFKIKQDKELALVRRPSDASSRYYGRAVFMKSFRVKKQNNSEFDKQWNQYYQQGQDKLDGKLSDH